MAHENASIAVVDDDPGILRSLSRLLGHYGYGVATYSSARALLAEVTEVSPDCIVVDLSMPEVTGLELQQELAKRRPACSVVFISGHGDIRSSVQAMRGGAVDFLVKPVEPKELVGAIERAFRRSAVRSEAGRELESFRLRLSTLTPREREVFDHIVDGKLNKQIGAALDITEKTVKVHRARVMRKMEVRSLARLARIAERLNAPPLAG